MMPNPTAASAAASVIIKMAKICPSTEPTSLEKATRLILTAFSINSTDIRMMITLRRVTIPTIPMASMATLRKM
jgi:hypothetical protein